MKQLRSSVLVLAVCVALAACQATTPERKDQVDRELGAALQTHPEAVPVESRRPVPVPEDVSRALLPPLLDRPEGVSRDPSRHQPERYSFAVKDVPAADFFAALVTDTPYNITVHPDVTGTITLQLKDVTVPEVLEVVRDVYGYDFRSTRSGYQVLPIRLRSHIFHVDYLNVNRTGVSNTTIRTGRQGADATVGADAATGGASDAVGAEISTEQPATTFWSELERSILTIIGKGDGRSVSVNPHSGIIVVRAMPGELREVSDFLDATENSVARQVILEAKIIEVTLNDGNQQGINWAFLKQGAHYGAVGGQFRNGRVIDIGDPSGNFSPFGVPILDANGATQVDPVSGEILRSSGLATNPFGGIFSVALQVQNFAAFVELLKTQGDVHVLSSPRISTLNNQKAVIKVGSEEFFVTDVNTTTNSEGSNVGVDVELAQFFSGIALDVTPQVADDGVVTLHIHPTVVTVEDQTKSFVVFGQDQVLPLAFSNARESDSIVRAASGQVVVIGGLIRNDSTDNRQAVPGLGELPVLGSLFRHEQKASVRSELVILLRPVVVDDSQPWVDDLRETRERVRSLGSQRPVDRLPTL